MNIPKTPLDNANKILLIGLGGGFDVFGGLPFVFHWTDKQFILTNHSPKSRQFLHQSTPDDYPEGMIPDIPNVIQKYSIGRFGSKLVEKSIQNIIDEHNPDCIFTVDGGVDSLARGNEEDFGTVLEDFITLAALQDINLPKVHCCVGFGTETEEDMNHYRILENMGLLAAGGHFYGSFSLLENRAFVSYVKACQNAWSDGRRKSHVQTKVISAVTGRFANDVFWDDIDPKIANSTGKVFISLLSSICWMFNLDAVIAKNKAVPFIKDANTFADSQILFRQFMSKQERLRSHLPIPL